MERTFIAIKPDSVQRGLIGKIIIRIEDKGFKIIGLKMLHVTEELAAKHYAEHVNKPFYKDLVKFITSAPIVAMVVAGENAVSAMRQLMGKTNPDNAEAGSIRASFSQEMSYNSIHGSDSIESAEREISIYFKEEELCNNWQTMFEILKQRLEG